MSKKVDEIIKSIPSYKELVEARKSTPLNESMPSTCGGFIYLNEEERKEFNSRLGLIDLNDFLNKMNKKYGF